MSADNNGHGLSAASRYRRPLLISFYLVLGFLIIEVVAGFATGSLALLSDAGHMATDALGLGMALAATSVAGRVRESGAHTFGLYRLEILAALANTFLLFGVAGYVLMEAVRRLDDPPELLTGPMLAVAIVGLLVNVVSWRLLRSGASASLNVAGAYLEVLADLIGSGGVIAAALAVHLFGWNWADPLIAAAIGVFILPRAWRLGRRTLRVLLQAAPEGLDLVEIRDRLAAIPGVVSLHDLHAWTLTSDMDVATLHVVAGQGVDPHLILDEAGDMLRNEFGIAHATLQVEPESHSGCAEISW
jgi:cobalt-zinc-cadmium efflux system protein